MQNQNKNSKKRLALLLAILTLAAPQVGFLPEALQNTPVAITEAHAQSRGGDDRDWQNRRRGNDYRDSDFNRYAVVTRSGVITSSPDVDYFEMRSENNETLRILARGNVSFRGYNRNDRVEVTGRLDGRNLIATSIRRVPATLNRQETLRATVVSNPTGNRFTIRHENRTVTVISQGNDARDLRSGQQVELRGTWRNNMFHADRVQVVNSRDNWQDRNRQTLEGTVTSVMNQQSIRVRTREGRTISVFSSARFATRINQGDVVEIQGRWNSSNAFNADSVRVTNDRYGSGNRDEQVNFRGTIQRSSRTSNNNEWDHTVRTDGRDFIVRTREQFRIGDRVRVRGVLRSGRVIASDISRF